MFGRGVAALSVGALLTAAIAFSTESADPAAAEMCPPVTMDVLFPPTTTPPPPETTTTLPVTTTTLAPTTTLPPTTTTTVPPSTTTTVSATTSTTSPGETTSTAPTTTTTTAVTTTSTTLAPETTTTLPPPPPCEPFVYDMAWPLAGAGHIGSPFGADRDGGARKHMGNDIAAPKLTPVVAVADGVVAKVAQEVGTENCCWAIVQHVDGWQSYYIHLNNDRHDTDDGLGIGVRTDLRAGSPVARGDVIGWVGDSGNAEETVDHLHFELRNLEGIAVDPRPSLLAAQAAAGQTDPQPQWPYADDDGHLGEWAAGWLLSEGLLLACDESRINFCPAQVADPGFASLVGAHLSGKSVPAAEAKRQPLPEHLEGADPRSLGSALGCDDLDQCLLAGLPETEVARLAIWIRTDALVSTLRAAPPSEGSAQVFLTSAADAEARLRALGARDTCNPPLDGERLLTRSETVMRLVAWVQGINPEPCQPAQTPAS